MKHKIISIFVIFALLLCDCNNRMENPPALTVTIGEQQVLYEVGINKWDGSIFDREDNFINLMKKQSSVDLLYAALGEEIKIQFEGTVPETYQLKFSILNEDGSKKYAEDVTQTINIGFEGNSSSFIIERNVAAMLSSDSTDYEPGAVICGFALICSWGSNECEYAFIVRSDAN